MKKVLALVLVAMMVIGIAPMTFAASATSGYKLGASGAAYDKAPGGLYDDGNRKVGDGVLEFMIENADGTQVTKAQVKANKIAVAKKVSEGSALIDHVSIEYSGQNAYVEVEFVDPWVSTSDKDYKFTIYLTVDKTKDDTTEIEIYGNLENDIVTVGADDDYVFCGNKGSNQPVIEAEAYIKAIDVEVMDGVIIHTKMFNDRKYYGWATDEIQDEDDSKISQYPDIDVIYTLKTIGLSGSGVTVSLDKYKGDKLPVYGANLEFLGYSNTKLPYSTKYYIASKLLDVATDDIDVEEPGDGTSEPNPNMGGDDVPENVNENPGTGC